LGHKLALRQSVSQPVQNLDKQYSYWNVLKMFLGIDIVTIAGIQTIDKYDDEVPKVSSNCFIRVFHSKCSNTFLNELPTAILLLS